MLLTEELIENLPVITEEQEHDEYWNEDDFINEGMRLFDCAISEIEKQYESEH